MNIMDTFNFNNVTISGFVVNTIEAIQENELSVVFELHHTYNDSSKSDVLYVAVKILSDRTSFQLARGLSRGDFVAVFGSLTSSVEKGMHSLFAVSYTHLTLPTICSV